MNYPQYIEIKQGPIWPMEYQFALVMVVFAVLLATVLLITHLMREGVKNG